MNRSPNNALQRTRAAVSLQSVPGESSASERRRAPLSLGPLGGRATSEERQRHKGMTSGLCLSLAGLLLSSVVLCDVPRPEHPALDPAKRLADAEARLSEARTEYERWVALSDAALLNGEAGSISKAQTYADEVLAAAPKHSRDWNYGNALHKGNLALGLVALKQGHVEKAKEKLLAAGRTPGSPQLNSFGPNMVLAKRLIELGERDVVLTYFDLCRQFWKMDFGKLTEWKESVRNGGTPDFGANLYY